VDAIGPPAAGDDQGGSPIGPDRVRWLVWALRSLGRHPWWAVALVPTFAVLRRWLPSMCLGGAWLMLAAIVISRIGFGQMCELWDRGAGRWARAEIGLLLAFGSILIVIHTASSSADGGSTWLPLIEMIVALVVASAALVIEGNITNFMKNLREEAERAEGDSEVLAVEEPAPPPILALADRVSERVFDNGRALEVLNRPATAWIPRVIDWLGNRNVAAKGTISASLVVILSLLLGAAASALVQIPSNSGTPSSIAPPTTTVPHTTSTSADTSPSTSSSTVVVTPTTDAPDPSFDEVCPGGNYPGTGASSWARTPLWDLFFKPGTGVGGTVGGCPGSLRWVQGPSERVEYQVCSFGNLLTGLILASDARRSAVFLGEPARYVAELLDGGTLVTGSARVTVGNGDMQVAYTPDGPIVFIRATKVTGPNREGAPYTILHPGAVQAWLDAMAVDGWRWPHISSDGHDLTLSKEATGQADMRIHIIDDLEYQSPYNSESHGVSILRPNIADITQYHTSRH